MSFCSIKDGNLLFTLSEVMEDMGFTPMLPVFNWCLKKDRSVDIFRLIDLEVMACSFKDASHDLTTAGEISRNEILLY